ncbi:MAG: winged helix-turn-helix domain-containing protein [Gammaproteobacteria bacterium]|nr:winged helix-turn-helix domain-containing protein [Gammaproteobacteria bacterium]
MADNADDGSSRRFRVLDLLVDLDRGTVSRGQRTIALPALSSKLLAVLIHHAPNPVSKDDLIREVWGNVVVGDETLAQRVHLLRQALDEDSQSPRYFASVRGRGYRLICDVRPISPAVSRSGVGTGFIGVAFALMAAAVLWFVTKPEIAPSPAASAASVAVLPFADLSASQSYGYFADGMQDELLARLAHIDGLHVSSRTSVEPFRATSLSASEIARELRVNNLIEGSVRVDEDRIRITVQLIGAQTDQHLWADTFDRVMSVQNIFSIQEEVARQVAQVLQREYASVTEPRPVQLPTGDLEAYNAFLLGRYHTFRQTPEDLELAVKNLELATTLDPDFVEAFAVLGWSYSFLGTNYGTLRPVDAYPKAKEAALRAIALDSNLSDARSLYADILTWYDWDFEAAEREYRKTMELDPLNVLGYALFLSSRQRHEEAIELIERRLKANPDDPYVRVNAAWRFLNARQYERAIEEAMLAGDHADAIAALGSAWFAMGDLERAVFYFKSDLEDGDRRSQQLSNLARAYYQSGQRTLADALLDELRNMSGVQFVSPALLAAVYFSAGDPDRGFASLQDAVDAKVRDVIFLREWSVLDEWRDDPRYVELIQAIGLNARR